MVCSSATELATSRAIESLDSSSRCADVGSTDDAAAGEDEDEDDDDDDDAPPAPLPLSWRRTFSKSVAARNVFK